MTSSFKFIVGTEIVPCRTEREAIWEFCERLLEDSTRSHPHYPKGTRFEVRKGDRTIVSYVVGYDTKPPSTTRELEASSKGSD